MDPQLLYPIEHGSEESQRDLLQVKLRDNLVRQRVDIISSVRFTLKSLGVRCLAQQRLFRQALPHSARRAGQTLLEMIEPSLQVIDIMTLKIRELDRAIEELCETKYPAPTPAPDHGHRCHHRSDLCSNHRRSRPLRLPARCGRLSGLVPKRDQSGKLDKQLRISKAGDAYLRRLLVGSAQYILGPFGPDCDLRRHGEARRARWRPDKKKAVVAIARKLSVLLLTLWKGATTNRCAPVHPAA